MKGINQNLPDIIIGGASFNESLNPQHSWGAGVPVDPCLSKVNFDRLDLLVHHRKKKETQ